MLVRQHYAINYDHVLPIFSLMLEHESREHLTYSIITYSYLIVHEKIFHDLSPTFKDR